MWTIMQFHDVPGRLRQYMCHSAMKPGACQIEGISSPISYIFPLISPLTACYPAILNRTYLNFCIRQNNIFFSKNKKHAWFHHSASRIIMYYIEGIKKQWLPKPTLWREQKWQCLNNRIIKTAQNRTLLHWGYNTSNRLTYQPYQQLETWKKVRYPHNQ